MTESQLQDAVIDCARTLGWMCAHFRPAKTTSGRWVTPVQADGAGYPDLTLVRDRVIFAELKNARRPLEPEQVVWRAWLEAAGAEYHLFRPADWVDGTIENILRRRTP